MGIQERVWARMKKIAQKKKPIRKTIKVARKASKVKRVTPNRSLDKYSVMLKRLGDHFGENAIPELLEFVVNYKQKKTSLGVTPKTTSGRYRLIKQNKV